MGGGVYILSTLYGLLFEASVHLTHSGLSKSVTVSRYVVSQLAMPYIQWRLWYGMRYVMRLCYVSGYAPPLWCVVSCVATVLHVVLCGVVAGVAWS